MIKQAFWNMVYWVSAAALGWWVGHTIVDMARGQEPLPKVVPKSPVALEIKAKAGDIIALTVESKGKVAFDFDDAAFPKGRAIVTDKTLYLTTPYNGKYRVTTTLFDEMTQHRTVLTVTGGTEPQPAPPVVDPIDDVSIAKALKALAASISALDAKFTQLEQRVQLLEGAKPPPKPPVPVPTDAAFPLDGKYRVLIIEETADRKANKYTNGQVAAIVGTVPRLCLDELCSPSPSGKKREYYIVDKDTDMSSTGAMWVRAMDYARKGPVPGIIVSNGKTEYHGELPKDDVVPLLRKMKDTP